MKTNSLISIIVGLLSLSIRLSTTKAIEETKCDDDDILINDLIISLENELHKGKNQEVITIGSILSNPLFTIGKYELRLKIGELVQKAAIAQFAILKDNKYKECEMIQLIDSIGWMKVELGKKVNEGRTDIENGRKIAETLRTNKGKFYEAKAYRHYGAIERRNHNWQKAFEYNDKSLEKANEITDDQLKTEAIAAAHYASAFVFKGQSDYENALVFLDKSISEFEKTEQPEAIIEYSFQYASLFFRELKLNQFTSGQLYCFRSSILVALTNGEAPISLYQPAAVDISISSIPQKLMIFPPQSIGKNRLGGPT